MRNDGRLEKIIHDLKYIQVNFKFVAPLSPSHQLTEIESDDMYSISIPTCS